MRRRHARRRWPASLLVALVAAAGGWGAGRTETLQLRAELARLERSNAQLASNAGVLAAALRDARAPLERHVFALEQRLGTLELLSAHAGSPAPGWEARGGKAAPAGMEATPSGKARASDGAPRPSVAPAEPLLGGTPAAPPGAPGRSAPGVGPVAAAPAPSRPAPSSAAEPVPDPLPAVSASPPARESQSGASAAPPAGEPEPDLACRSLDDADFALLGLGDEVSRLSGRLSLSLSRQGDELAVRVAGDPGSPYRLTELPLHFAYDCDDVPYLVSICSLQQSPPEVRGSISHADRWKRPCRAELLSGGGTERSASEG